MLRTVLAASAAVFLLTAPTAQAQMTPQPAGTAEQREAMARLSWMDGEWVGTAETYAGPGSTRTHPHTERIGPMLGGSIKVIEGRSVGGDGAATFNAFAVISWDDARDRYVMRSYANGQAADFPFQLTPDGFAWAVQANGGEVRYVTSFRDGEWVEVGDFVMPGREPMRVVELRLRRRGDSTWPAAGAVVP